MMLSSYKKWICVIIYFFRKKKHVTVVGNGQNWMNWAYVIIVELNLNIYSPKMIRIAY